MTSDVETIEIWKFSNASFNIAAGRDYGKAGILTKLKVEGKVVESVFQVVDWAITKKRRVSHSSYGAEILECSNANDRG